MTPAGLLKVPTLDEVGRMKREAKRQKKARGITHAEALGEQAQARGFRNWSLLMKVVNRQTKEQE